MFVILWIGYNQIRAPKHSRGTIAPNFTATNIEGKTVQLSDFEGKYILLDFWASWCGPCRRDNPQLVKLYEKYKTAKFKDADGFVILSVALEQSEKRWLDAIKADNLDWETHISTAQNPNQIIPDLYQVTQVPTKFMISPDGQIMGTNWTFNRLNRFLSRNRKN